MPGHLFLLHGDIRTLSCDAWLLPTDSAQHLSPTWPKSWPRNFTLPPEPTPPPDWRRGSIRPWPDWPADRSPPWLAAIGSPTAPDWPTTTPLRWLDLVSDHLAHTHRPPRHGRAVPLVALPVFGTGSGGRYQSAGEVLRSLVPALERRLASLDLDVALVTNEPEAFAAARAVRGTDPSHWPALTDAEHAAARDLARRAGNGNLVLFLGAGVSIGAGMPDWNELLAELATDVHLDAKDAGWRALDLLDQASIIQRRLPPSTSLGERIASRFVRPEASLQHLLLADLPVTEAVTTNYDDLFELASGIDSVSVIPHAPRQDARRWLLKMHGCVTRPEDVVLTRADYLRYEQRRVALAGIVQAMLITRHMLFVGFSLRDDNFHKVADAVRRARDPAHRTPGPFGTVLKLAREPFVEELWKGDVNFVSMGEPIEGDKEQRTRESAKRARRLEIFLDALLAHAPIDPGHFFVDRFSGTLTDGERSFRDALQSLLDQLPDDARRGPAWERLRKVLEQLGSR